MLTTIGARSVKKLLLPILGWTCILFVNAAPAHAAKWVFGTQDYVAKIQDTSIKGPKDEVLYLGYKYSTHAFLLPYHLSAEGYILGVQGDRYNYYKLGDAQTKELQARGLLPTPLPPYEIPLLDYIFAYFLWIVLALAAVGSVATLLSRKRRTRALPQLN